MGRQSRGLHEQNVSEGHPNRKPSKSILNLSLDIQNATRLGEEKAKKLLEKHGIQAKFSVRIKTLTGRNKKSLGLYRSGTIYRHGKPIIWINSDIEETMREYKVSPKKMPTVITDTILHEYAHAIADKANFLARMVGGTTRLMEVYKKHFSDEEEFAEGFISFCRKGQGTGYAELVAEFNKNIA